VILIPPQPVVETGGEERGGMPMRPTWLVLGLIVIIGSVAYLKLKAQAEDEPGAAPGEAAVASRTPGLERTAGEAPAPLEEAEASRAAELEQRAGAILEEIAQAHKARDRARYDQALAQLKAEAWEAPSARRFAVKLGWSVLEGAYAHEGVERVRRLDQARRLLSRGVYAPDAFAANGRPTAERAKLVAAIQKANVEVMGHAPRMGGGLEGVTRPFEVPPGWVPVRIVSRERLPYGHNALLYWNHAGNLDPRRLRAGEVLLLPLEPLSVHVFLDQHLIGLFLGDWFVKEFRVGVGRSDKPTPTGSFEVGPKQENPDWWGPNGFVPALDPKNELGSVWIPFSGPTLPLAAGFGIHGTNRPATVGTDCSNGCVRLTNADATEIFWWVRTGSAGGEATKVHVHRR